MARVLHLLKGDDPALALAVIAQQQAAGDEIGVALLPGAPAPALPAGVTLQRVPRRARLGCAPRAHLRGGSSHYVVVSPGGGLRGLGGGLSPPSDSRSRGFRRAPPCLPPKSRRAPAKPALERGGGGGGSDALAVAVFIEPGHLDFFEG